MRDLQQGCFSYPSNLAQPQLIYVRGLGWFNSVIVWPWLQAGLNCVGSVFTETLLSWNNFQAWTFLPWWIKIYPLFEVFFFSVFFHQIITFISLAEMHPDYDRAVTVLHRHLNMCSIILLICFYPDISEPLWANNLKFAWFGLVCV